jgi:hypothetical protein
MSIAPTVLILEGGYNLEATANCTESCLRAMMGEVPKVDFSAVPKRIHMNAIQEALKIQVCLWPAESDVDGVGKCALILCRCLLFAAILIPV